MRFLLIVKNFNGDEFMLHSIDFTAYKTSNLCLYEKFVTPH